MFTIPVLYGSVRQDRQGIKAARWMVKKLQERGHNAVLVDPLEVQLPLLDKMYKEFEPGSAPENLQKLADLYKEADAFVIVTGEYNHSPPPALTNLLDHFLEDYFWRPAAIASYSAGSFGGVRAAVSLRALIAELGMPTIPSMFPISKVQDTFDEEGNALEDAYNSRVTKFLDELEWYAAALKAQREKGTPY